MEIRSFPERDVPPALRVQVLALQRQAWPAGEVADDRDPSAEAAHDPALHPLSMLLIEDAVVLAALDILSKDLMHQGRRYAVSGLSTVVVHPASRGRGYGRQLVSAARARIAGSDADLGIFTCDRPLQAFYEAAGWSTLLGTVLIGGSPEAPFPSDQFDKVTMAAFFSAKALQAADSFNHCRIELYPGNHDKLW
jgi:aminoglycoside 2'-N-acetyltransferase I